MKEPSKINLTKFTEEQIDNEIDFICGDSTSFWETEGIADIVKKHGYQVDKNQHFAYIDLDQDTRQEIKESLFYNGV